MKSFGFLVLLMANTVFAGTAPVKSSFEDGTFAGWNVQGGEWSIYTKAGSDGKKSAMCSISKGRAAGVLACARVIEKASPGWMVKVDLDVAGKAKYKNSKMNVSVMCIDADGNTIKEVKKQISTPSTSFQKVSLDELMIPSGTAETYLMIVVELADKSRGKEWWRFDNVVIQVK